MNKTIEALVEALNNIVHNAEIIPDPKMGGTADCYRVPLDDIDAAAGLLGGILRDQFKE